MKGLFDDEIIPIPYCQDFIDDFGKERGYDTPQKVANEIMREAKKWQGEHPGVDLMEIITPDWREYVKANLPK